MFHSGSKLRYVCDDGYMLQPSYEVQICQEGLWNPQIAPDCVKESKTDC